MNHNGNICLATDQPEIIFAAENMNHIGFKIVNDFQISVNPFIGIFRFDKFLDDIPIVIWKCLIFHSFIFIHSIIISPIKCHPKLYRAVFSYDLLKRRYPAATVMAVAEWIKQRWGYRKPKYAHYYKSLMYDQFIFCFNTAKYNFFDVILCNNTDRMAEITNIPITNRTFENVNPGFKCIVLVIVIITK